MCEKCNKGKYYITTAIAYASGKPHIGNTYEVVLADAIARYKRSQGYDVFFQTGTDEHGQKIELKADEAGITPKQFVDNAAGEIKKINLSVRLMRIMKHRSRKFSKDCTIRETFIRVHTRECTVLLVSPFGQSLS